MSELGIALVAEGVTDQTVIESALRTSKAIESWVAEAWLPVDHALLAGDIEYRGMGLESMRIVQRPIPSRVSNRMRPCAAASRRRSFVQNSAQPAINMQASR
jgi:hypothetical protein